MKISLCTGIHGRYEITKMWLAHLSEVKDALEQVGINLIPCIAGSEGLISRNMVEQFGFNYVEIHNQPLGNKINTAINLGRAQKPDYYLLSGSDDFFNSAHITEALENQRFEIFGFNDMEVRSIGGDRMFISYKNSTRIMGCFTLIAARVMPGIPYNPTASIGLDGSLMRQVHGRKIVKSCRLNPVYTIKGNECLHTFDSLFSKNAKRHISISAV